MDTKSLWRSTWGSVRRGVVGSMAAVLFGGVILVASIMAAANPLKVQQFEGVVNKPITIEYYLPYPGMLPDNPLYRIKSVRDRVRLWLTSSELKKAELKLAYADKRINAAVFLLDGGKQKEAVSTATKAEKYLEESVEMTLKMTKDGQDVKSLLLTLSKATAKHYELLSGMQRKAESVWQEVLSQTKEKTNTMQQRVDQALMENK